MSAVGNSEQAEHGSRVSECPVDATNGLAGLSKVAGAGLEAHILNIGLHNMSNFASGHRQRDEDQYGTTAGARAMQLERLKMTEWFHDRGNVGWLVEWLYERGWVGEELRRVVQEPEAFGDEWRRMQAERKP